MTTNLTFIITFQDADSSDDDAYTNNNQFAGDTVIFHHGNSHLVPYTNYKRYYAAHKELHKKFEANPFGHACSVCGRLWFKNDLKSPAAVRIENLEIIFPGGRQPVRNRWIQNEFPGCQYTMDLRTLQSRQICRNWTWFPRDSFHRVCRLCRLEGYAVFMASSVFLDR